MKINIISILFICLFTLGATAQVDRSKQPEPGPAPKINLGQPESFTLKNGLEVLVVENHKLPRVTASLIINNKPHSLGAKPATTSLLAALLGTGTQKTSKDAFNEEIDFLGANISFGSSSASASSLSKFFPRVLELMAEGALTPKFSQTEFDSEKNKLIEGIKSNEKNVGAIASRVASALVYGNNHPYGEFPTVESTETVTLQDVQNYYNIYYAPKNAYMVVVGDIKASDVKKLVEKHFVNWKGATPPEQNLPKVTNVPATEINFIDMPNAVQSEIRVSNTYDLKMADDDYFPVMVTNQILGGSFGSYLNMNLREARGYTYGAGSSTGVNKHTAARFNASTSVRNAVTDSAVVEIMKEIRRIKTEPVDAEMLENAKAKFAGDFVLRLERPATIANYALNIKTNDLPDNFYETYLQRINAVTPSDIQRVANKYYQTDNMRIVIAGKGSEVIENLEKVKIDGKNVPIKYFNSNGVKVDKPNYNQAIDPSVTAETVFNKYIQAIGGKAAVDKVNSVYMIADAEIQGQKLKLETKTTTTGKFSQIVSMGGMTISKQIFDGTKGSATMQGQKVELNEDQLIAIKAEANPFPELTLKNAKLNGIEPVGGKDAYAIAISDDTTVFYDVETGLKVQSVKTVSQGGQTMSVPTGFGNYKEVKGVKFPSLISQSFGPQTIEFEVNEIKINEGVADADFVE
jgi:zinc protease